MSLAATIESIVASGGRLRILTALATNPRQEFVQLRQRTGLTDGNLCSHTRRLETAGLVVTEKSFRQRKPVTHVALTTAGRSALEQHARELLAALGITAGGPATGPLSIPRSPLGQMDGDPSDVWVD